MIRFVSLADIIVYLDIDNLKTTSSSKKQYTLPFMKVRLSSFRAMCACAKTFEFGIPSADVGVSSPTSCASPSTSAPIPGDETLVKDFLSSLVTRLATSPKWLDRQVGKD